MGQDWGGPVSMAVGTARAERVLGVILGNTWFWPVDQLGTKLVSRVTSTAWMQRQILGTNFFVERIVPPAMAHRLTPGEMDHYRNVQASPDARRGAEMPRQILGRRLLQRLAHDAPATLGAKPALLVWGMKDFVFKPARLLLRMQATFADNVTVELPHARHYIQKTSRKRSRRKLPNALADDSGRPHPKRSRQPGPDGQGALFATSDVVSWPYFPVIDLVSCA
jgi:haloalkane dehalogenase